MGYRLEEIRGRHHRIFCPPGVADTAEYRALWSNLRDGEFVSGEFRRAAKDGRDVWLQASYNPVLDAEGQPSKGV